MLFEETINGFQVMSDGRRVWVNSPTTGASVARFSAIGGTALIDIHREPDEQRTKGQCLACAQGECSLDMWLQFKSSLLEHYGVDLPDTHCPKVLHVEKN